MLPRAHQVGVEAALAKFGVEGSTAGAFGDLILRAISSGVADPQAYEGTGVDPLPDVMHHVPHGVLPGLGAAFSAPKGESKLLHGALVGGGAEAVHQGWSRVMDPATRWAIQKAISKVPLDMFKNPVHGALADLGIAGAGLALSGAGQGYAMSKAMKGGKNLASKIDHKLKDRSNDHDFR